MRTTIALTTVLALLVATGAVAQNTNGASPMKGMDMSKPDAKRVDGKTDAAKPEPAAMTDGEVRKLDKDRGLVTLKHAEIRNLGMAGMTMVFHAADKAMLDKVQQGDKVRFTAESVNNQLTVTRIDVAR